MSLKIFCVFFLKLCMFSFYFSNSIVKFCVFCIFVFTNVTSPSCILYMYNVHTIIGGTQAEIGLQLRARREICFQGLFIYFLCLILRNQ